LAAITASGFAKRPVPPAEFETLEVTYRLEPGPKLTETRIGRIRLNDTPALSAVKRVVVPLRNAAEIIQMRELALIASNGSESSIQIGAPQKSGSLLSWEVPKAKAGDSIRFVVEQPIDLRGHASGFWWFSDSTLLPLPVKAGSVKLHLPADFRGAVDIMDKARHARAGVAMHLWTLDGVPAAAGASHFLITSFRSWEEFSKWIAERCPADPGGGVRQLAKMLESGDAGTQARNAAAILGDRLRVRPFSPRQLEEACRPVEQVLRAGEANPLEAQAVLMALLAQAGVSAEAFLSGARGGAEQTVNPEVFSRALVRVHADNNFLWFDATRLMGASGDISLGTVPESALALRGGQAFWIPVLPESRANEPGSVTAKLDAGISVRGTLHATVTLSASGPPSEIYREAYRAGAGRADTAKFFTAFVRDLQRRSVPVVSDTHDVRRPFQLQMPIRHEQFLMPIQRQLPLQLDVIPLVEEPIKLADGKILLGTPGRRQEEIILEVPPGYAITAEVRVDEKRAFGHYRSEAAVAGGKLRVTRAFVLTAAVIEASRKSEMDGLWYAIRRDQQRTFLLRRTGPIDLREWIESIPTSEAYTTGLEAFEQWEYRAARQLLERAVKANPNDPYAWNDLGRALHGLGRLDEARKAYEKQIAISPKHVYAYNNLGLVFAEEGRWEKAVESYQKQLEVHSGDVYATRNLPRALLQLGRWAEAANAATKAVAAQPDSGFGLYAAVATVCQGGISEAGKEFDAAWGTHPSATALNTAAYYLSECGKELDLAEDYIGRSLEQMETFREPTIRQKMSGALSWQAAYGSYLDTYGWILFKRGHPERAAKILAPAATLKQSAEIFMHLATVMWTLGRTEEALRWGQEAMFLGPGYRSKLPPELAARLGAGPALSVDGIWYPVSWPDAGAFAASLLADRPLYYYVVAGEDGVQFARPLDAANDFAQSVLPEIRKLKFPAVYVRGRSLPVAQFVKLEKPAGGNPTIFRSVAPAVDPIAMEFAPEEFPVPSPQGRKTR
jgi:tetratricopeptide (TPR) repeat protein